MGILKTEARHGRRYGPYCAQVTVKDAFGNPRQPHKHFSTRAEAVKWVAEVKAQAARGEMQPASTMLLMDLAEKWLEERVVDDSFSPASFKQWRIHCDKYIVKLLGGILVQRLTVYQVEAALRWWSRGPGKTRNPLSKQYVNTILGTLSQILDMAVRYRLRTDNPARQAKRLKVPNDEDSAVDETEIYSKEELRRLIEATPPATSTRCLVMTLAFTGIRIGELLGMTWPELDLKDGALRIRHQQRGGELVALKNKNARRDFVLPAPLVHELRQWRLRCPINPLQFVFVSGSGRPLDRKTTWKMLQAVERRAAVRPMGHHRLRHTFASHLLMDGHSDIEVAYLLGHKDSTITRRIYAHFLKRDTGAVAELAKSILQK